MSAWGLRLNPWGTSYSSLEADQMRFIHKAYCEAMEVSEEDLPPQLKMSDTFYPLYRPTISDFDQHTFMRKMQDVVGLLRNPAEAIISTICAYQRERQDRFSFGGYLNDPRTLLLEEFKDWAMKTLAPASCTTESILNEVRRRHSYVLRLQHGQQGLFAAGSGERSLMGTLKDVRSVIETRVLPTIEAERAHSSAREQLHTLEARGTDGLMHGVQFLFYVLRNTPNTPADCTISNLQSQQHSGMRDAMQTKSGEMLQVLLTTPSFKTLFPESGVASPRDSLRPLQLTNEEEAEIAQTAVFCDTESKAIVPSVLTRSPRGSSTAMTSPANFLRQSNSGVVPLREEVAVETYDMYTKLHGLLKLLADLLVSCRKARQLAGPGGDLLVYGPGGEEVRRLMQSLESVQSEIGKIVTKLTQIGVRELDRLKPNQEKAWRYCFSKVLPLENYIAHDFGACVEPIQRMYSNADPVHVQKMYKQFRQATGMWVQENNSICRHVYAALGQPFVERRSIQQSGQPEDDNGPVIELIEDSPNTQSNALVPATRTNSKYIEDDRRSSRNVSRNNQKPLLLEDSNNQSSRFQDVTENDNQQLVVAAPPKSNQSGSSISSEAAGALYSIAATLTWAVGSSAKKQPSTVDPAPVAQIEPAESVGSAPGSSSSTQSAGNPAGVLDVLLLVRQSIQKFGQLSWGVRTSFHTSSIDEGDFDAFIFLCSIYEDVGVPCSSDLLVRIRQHRLRLGQLLKRHITSVLGCIEVLQRRILDEEKSIRGMLLVYRRMETIMTDFDMELDALLTNFRQMMVDCMRMKNGIMAMPLQQHNDSRDQASAAAYAYSSINALATRLGGNQAPSAAILSHGEYMTQMTSQMDLHWNSMSHLLQNLKGTLETVTNVVDRLKDCAKDSRNVVPAQQLDYIFEYHYDGFFRQSTKDLQFLLTSFDDLRQQ